MITKSEALTGILLVAIWSQRLELVQPVRSASKMGKGFVNSLHVRSASDLQSYFSTGCVIKADSYRSSSFHDVCDTVKASMADGYYGKC